MRPLKANVKLILQLAYIEIVQNFTSSPTVTYYLTDMDQRLKTGTLSKPHK